MDRGGKEGGEIRPAAPSDVYLPVALIAITLAAALAATVLLLVQHERIAVAMWFLSALIAFAMLLVLTRRTRVAASAVLAALGGASAGTIVLTLLDAPRGGQLVAFALGVAISGYVADAFVDEILVDGRASVAASMARRRVAFPAVFAALVAAAFPFVLLFAKTRAIHAAEALAVALEIAITLVFALLALPEMLRLWTYHESFVVEANRRREKRIVRAYRASMVSVPRWGMSLSGIALVFAVLAIFPAASVAASGLPTIVLYHASAVFIVSLVGGICVTAAWRETLAVVLAVTYLQLFVLALAQRVPGIGLVLPAGAPAAVSVGLLSILMIAERARMFRKSGDDPSIARLRSIEEGLSPVIFVTLAAIAALLLWWLMDVATLMLFVLGAFSAVLVAPSFATALETLLPRRRSVEELYSRR